MGVYDVSSKRTYLDFSWRERVPGFPLCGAIVEAILEGEQLTVRHETAHQLVGHLCPTLSANMPNWLAEGLACAFELDRSAGVQAYRLVNKRRAKS